MDPVWSTLTCPLCGTTLVASRPQFPEMAHADAVAMNFLQKAMEVHWARFCSGGEASRPSLAAPARAEPHGERRGAAAEPQRRDHGEPERERRERAELLPL